MGGWLKDVKDADKVALLVLLVGLACCVFSTLMGLFIVVRCTSMAEATEDRSLGLCKDLFAVGGSLISAALISLRFQSKSADPPIVDVKQTTTSTTVATNSQEPK